ncbi:MAG TPA: molybdopterin-dependent oxidoreductase, partial [Humisphaera sp.]
MTDRHDRQQTQTDPAALNRRAFLRWAAASAVPAFTGVPGFAGRVLAADVPTPADVLGGPTTRPARPMARFPEKTDLILLTDRPPNLETPLRYFREDFTPNEAFFVRWHLGIVPTSIDTKTYRLKVTGNVDNALALSLDDLRKQFEPATVVAVNQCSGNGRGLFLPRVPGGQWENGALGNAKWTGVRLADVLKKAGVKTGSVDVTFGGMDKSPMPTVQPFVKSIPVDHPKLAEVILAYEMNGKPLPVLNGFPLRVVVP